MTVLWRRGHKGLFAVSGSKHSAPSGREVRDGRVQASGVFSDAEPREGASLHRQQARSLPG